MNLNLTPGNRYHIGFLRLASAGRMEDYFHQLGQTRVCRYVGPKPGEPDPDIRWHCPQLRRERVMGRVMLRLNGATAHDDRQIMKSLAWAAGVDAIGSRQEFVQLLQQQLHAPDGHPDFAQLASDLSAATEWNDVLTAMDDFNERLWDRDFADALANIDGAFDLRHCSAPRKWAGIPTPQGI